MASISRTRSWKGPFSWHQSDDATLADFLEDVGEDDEFLDEPLALQEQEPEPYVPIQYTPSDADLAGLDTPTLERYAAVADQVGFSTPAVLVERMKAYLRRQAFPVYDLATVVKFMDEKSMHEGDGWGWRWLPLRERDHLPSTRWFGTSSAYASTWGGDKNRPASDYYAREDRGGRVLGPTYDKVVPLHALEKVAKIEAEFGHPVSFMVSDYETAPAFPVDPFLMVVVENPQLTEGVGRFVIDVWDEPGFGLEQMLVPGV